MTQRRRVSPLTGTVLVLAGVGVAGWCLFWPWPYVIGMGSTAFQYLRVGNETDVGRPTRFGLVLEGGGTDIDESFEWMIERSGGV